MPIAFGGAAISGEGGGYGFGKMSEKEAENLLHFAWERGIRVFDTAPIYGFGLSEERMGRYLPAEAVIISKGGVHWHPSRRVNMTNDPGIMEEMLLASLKRLKRDHIPVYMIHWPDPKVDIRLPLAMLKSYQEKGIIGELGLCNTTPQDLEKAQEIADIKVLQSEVNLFNHQALHQLASTTKITMGWGTFDKGILSGRVSETRTFEKEDCRSWAPWWNKKEVRQKINKVIALEELLKPHDLSLKQFALHFNLQVKKLSFTLVGSKTTQDLQEVLELQEEKISPELVAAIFQKWGEVT